MTESEIMKALECCAKVRCLGDCEDLNCPAFTKQGCMYYLRTDEDFEGVIFAELIKDALDLLNRKNADIARLEKSRAEWKEAALRKTTELDKSQNELSKLKFDLMCGTSKAQTTVIQLLVGRLKDRKRKMLSSDWDGEFWDFAVLVTDIDKTAKEMGVEL